ncbi:hypothetical protein COHA_010541 [Chlorella ohadii]|uniref:DNL-type domain-containing protein n=1 Tax=Chlorella ohadii TaxID=2649997 RepID=A0AAD5DCM5_9CHLO|nr:hypothetical protein COHA_010541 [Chlorella ohadii]
MSLHSGGTRPVYGPLAHDTFVMQRPEIGGPGLLRFTCFLFACSSLWLRFTCFSFACSSPQLRFTCNLCGETNDCEVNPHAWAKGSVFARCQGCTAVHKLKDNLNIFHELAGPVFPPRELRSSYLVQEILDRIQENNRN